tara:strand:- start:1895 stop:2188 length:294 start_codon:yes stop_codon:yes gene_type:complete
MTFLNDFKNLFAIVGVLSIIFWTCASESTSTNVNPPQLTGGTYQVSKSGNTMVILNTETGVLKSYVNTIDTNYEWVEASTYDGSGNLLGSGNLTVNH